MSMAKPGALSREQVEYICKFLVEEHLSKDASTILDHDAALRTRVVELEREVEKWHALLLKSCRDNIEDYKVECKPSCDEYVHAEDCHSAYPGLVYDELRQQLTQLQAALTARENELCTAKDQIPPDMEEDSLSVALIKLKDKLVAVITEQDDDIEQANIEIARVQQARLNETEEFMRVRTELIAERDAAVQEAGRLREQIKALSPSSNSPEL